MNKYEYLKESLAKTGTGTMKCFGNSMLPKLENPSICAYAVQNKYEIGDIVFCKVRGRYIDAHLITKIDGDRYMIANNHGWENGWTKTIYGKVVSAVNKNNKVTYKASVQAPRLCDVCGHDETIHIPVCEKCPCIDFTAPE